MPANTTPEYKAAEKAFRRAREPQERLDLLREMLRAVPKHKGTEHLQADIKTRVKELTDELSGPRKTGVRGGPPTVVHPEGAAQVAMVGAPNTGKSTLHVALTGSHSQCGPYPFTTQYPHPGMFPVDDVHIQLVDLPPLSPQHPVAWIGNALQPADACMLVVDLGVAGCVEHVLVLHEMLRERRVELTASWDEDDDDEMAPFTVLLPTVVVATKADAVPGIGEELAVFMELSGLDYPALCVSAETGAGIVELGRWLFERLGIVRVYTKLPGGHPDMGRPFTVRHGQTVLDVALLVHRDIAGSFKYARLWGGGEFDGQQVGADHVVADGDVIELHS